MPLMYPEAMPELIDGQASPESERLVYNACRERLADDFTVFYRTAWLARPHGGAPLDGEADFIMAHPREGVLVVEVKGGGVGRDPAKGVWYSVDHGNRRHIIKDPFEQAKRCKYALFDKVQGMPGWKNRKFDAGHAVLFPDVRRQLESLGPEAETRIVGCCDDLSRLDKWVGAALKYWRGVDGARRALGPEGVELLTGLLAKRFEIDSPLTVELDAGDREILRLTEGQFHVIDMLSRNRRVGICGGAGTGKTVLALEKAQRLASEGFKTLLTCFNKPLAEHLRTRSVKYRNLTVYNFHQLCDILGRKAGCPVREPAGPMPPPAYFNETLPGFLVDAMDKLPGEKFDAIVVDEGQDFADDWWAALDLSFKEPEHGVLYVFHDDNQRIYRQRRTFPRGLVEVRLSENLRNTKAIHAVARQFYAGELVPVGPRGRAVQFGAADGPEEARAQVVKTVRKLLKEDRVALEDLVILSGHSKEHSRLLDNGMIGEIPVTFDYLTPEPGKVLFDSIHRFKGLERKIVILVELDHLPRLQNGEELLYVALSRARTYLVVIGNRQVLDAVRVGV